MERHRVSSSFFTSIGYDPDTETLEIQFAKRGGVRQYYNVPQSIYERLRNAPSDGEFFDSEIKYVYPWTRL